MQCASRAQDDKQKKCQRDDREMNLENKEGGFSLAEDDGEPVQPLCLPIFLHSFDLVIVLEELAPEVSLPSEDRLTRDSIKGMMDGVRRASAARLQRAIDTTSRLYLLHGRVEPEKEKPPRQVTSMLRHYLEIASAKHRVSMTRLLLSDHLLAVERLRYTERGRPAIPRELRLCRFCKVEVETPEHALLICTGDIRLIELREVFLMQARWEIEGVPVHITGDNAVECLKGLIYERRTIDVFAKFVHEALCIFRDTPLERARGRESGQFVITFGSRPFRNGTIAAYISYPILSFYRVTAHRKLASKARRSGSTIPGGEEKGIRQSLERKDIIVQRCKDGLVQSKGVSNFNVAQLEEFCDAGQELAAVNRISLIPRKNGFQTAAYSPLLSLIFYNGGSVNLVASIEAFVKTKGSIPVEQVLRPASQRSGRATRNKDGIANYLAAAKIQLSPEDVEAIDEAGLKGGREKFKILEINMAGLESIRSSKTWMEIDDSGDDTYELDTSKQRRRPTNKRRKAPKRGAKPERDATPALSEGAKLFPFQPLLDLVEWTELDDADAPPFDALFGGLLLDFVRVRDEILERESGQDAHEEDVVAVDWDWDIEGVPWMAVMADVRAHYALARAEREQPLEFSGPIAYVTLQAHHLEQVHDLLERVFWAGIDVSDSLQNVPSKSTIIATYKHLIVGVAILASPQEPYITYLAVRAGWEGAQIATCMLYHLIQLNPNRDITLHVSANNPAMLLYNRFGFKAEEFVAGFYEDYLDPQSRASKNAFRLRLRR
ncbi:hypothetical protein HWV62_13319 [Athelia sp. TMB]|nr:hypothetical protein HWV62_13319 [Athelia sp. TMB]